MEIYKYLEKNYIKFGNKKITVVIDKNNQAWFSCKETTKILGYTGLKQAIRKNINKENLSQLKDINISRQKRHPHTLFMDETGLYTLMLRSRMPLAKRFTAWVTGIVLPSIRKYGYYKLKKQYESESNKFMKEINALKNENALLRNIMKKEKYPDGGVVYAVDVSDNGIEMYRIGMTGNMEMRKKGYDTHTMKKKDWVHYEKTNQPIRFETCLRMMLYNFRIKNRKDVFECSLGKIKKAFEKCAKEMTDNQKGGEEIIASKISKAKNKVKRLNEKIKKLNKKLQKK